MDRTKSTLKHIAVNHSYILSFVLLCIVAIAVNPNFLTFNNISLLLLQSTIKGIIAIGMTLVIISGQIDLSLGSMAALVSGLGVVVLNSTGSAIITLVFCLIFGLLLGMINGVLVTKGRMAPFIVTLATMAAFRSVIIQLGQGGPFNISYDIVDTFRMIAAGETFGIPNLVYFFIAVTIIISWMMRTTKIGRYIYAVGSNQRAAQLNGINVDRVKTFVFSMAGLLTGLSSFLLMSRLTSITAANVGMAFETDAIAATAIGGTNMAGGRGRIIGTFLGAIMLQMIEGILVAAKIPPFLNGLVKGVIIIIAVLIQRSRLKEQ